VTLFIVTVLLTLSISGLCSLLEATLLSFTPSQVANLANRKPRLGAIWQNFKSNIERPIAVILLINTAAHTIGATMAGAQFEKIYGDEGVIWFSLLFTYVMLQFTEILPKTIGVLQNSRLAPIVALPLAFLVRVLSPVLYVVHMINRPFEGKRPKEKGAPHKDIIALAGLARLSRYIDLHQERVIKGAAQLSEKTVRDVMIPLHHVAFLSTSQSPTEALTTAQYDLHTRFPVTKGEDRHHVLGYVNLKELVYLLQATPKDVSLHGIIRPVHFVGVDQPANELMRVFVERHEHMAIVQDNEGKTVGLITLEDVVEELVGEIEDEFDRQPQHLHRLSGGTWMAGGGLPVAELARKTGFNLPDAEGSTSAWLIKRLGRSPKPTEVIRAGGAEFTIRRIRRGCVFEVSVAPDKTDSPKE